MLICVLVSSSPLYQPLANILPRALARLRSRHSRIPQVRHSNTSCSSRCTHRCCCSLQANTGTPWSRNVARYNPSLFHRSFIQHPLQKLHQTTPPASDPIQQLQQPHTLPYPRPYPSIQVSHLPRTLLTLPLGIRRPLTC